QGHQDAGSTFFPRPSFRILSDRLRARMPMPPASPSRRGTDRYIRITTIHVIQLERSLQDRLWSMSHGWVYAAVHDSQSPCARAMGRATTRLARKPCALGLERFHTHVTSPQPWLSLAPTTSRSCSAAS